jgi:hypothetical protein
MLWASAVQALDSPSQSWVTFCHTHTQVVQMLRGGEAQRKSEQGEGPQGLCQHDHASWTLQVGLAGPSGSGKTVFSERVKALIPGKEDSVPLQIAPPSCERCNAWWDLGGLVSASLVFSQG